jgi:hypothetical protein
MMIGVIVSAVLHGITLLQALIYWMSKSKKPYPLALSASNFRTEYKKDAWYLKLLVHLTLV